LLRARRASELGREPPDCRLPGGRGDVARGVGAHRAEARTVTFLVALAAALAPSMSIAMISTPELTKLKTWWLLGVMWLGAGCLLLHEPWLGVMAVWYCIKWRSIAEHP